MLRMSGAISKSEALREPPASEVALPHQTPQRQPGLGQSRMIDGPSIPRSLTFQSLFMPEPQPESLVELRNLTFGYGERVILDDISLTVPRALWMSF